MTEGCTSIQLAAFFRTVSTTNFFMHWQTVTRNKPVNHVNYRLEIFFLKDLWPRTCHTPSHQLVVRIAQQVIQNLSQAIFSINQVTQLTSFKHVDIFQNVQSSRKWINNSVPTFHKLFINANVLLLAFGWNQLLHPLLVSLSITTNMQYAMSTIQTQF